jgi:hypothetical protein
MAYRSRTSGAGTEEDCQDEEVAVSMKELRDAALEHVIEWMRHETTCPTHGQYCERTQAGELIISTMGYPTVGLKWGWRELEDCAWRRGFYDLLSEVYVSLSTQLDR